jgi:hypothetical protein
MEKKQTAVEWFAKQLGITTGSMLENAIKLEKDQIMLAFNDGAINMIDWQYESMRNYYDQKYKKRKTISISLDPLYGKKTIGNDHHGISSDNPIQHPDSFRYDGC